MSCIQHCYGHHRAGALKRERATALVANAGATRGRSESSDGLPKTISGTWDFKWPIGKVIRFAFQALPNDLDPNIAVTGKALVQEKLAAWLRAEKYAPNLDYTIIPGEYPAPFGRTKHGVRWAHSVGGSADYDVLISFLPLPVALPATEQHPEAAIGTSASELGRYAERVERGVPTMYLGAWEGFDPSTWFARLEGQFAVVHEIGHALGMPHEQQNPLAYDLPWKTLDEMKRLLRTRSGLARFMDLEAFITEEIVGRWPGEIVEGPDGKASVRFSDWRTPAAKAPSFDFQSVMAKPSYQCLLQGVHPASECTPDGCSILERALSQLLVPTEYDLAHLETMYGTRASGAHTLASAPPPPSSNKVAAQ